MPNPLKQFKDYFNFNRTEQRGLSVLFILLLLIIGLNLMMPYLFKPETIDFTDFESEIAKFEQQQAAAKDSLLKLSAPAKSFTQTSQSSEGDHIQPFPFDPNNLPRDKWQQLGLTDPQIDVIKNYESKGGQFKTKNDLAKIYSISDVEFAKLEPYIKIENVGPEKKSEPILTPIPFDPNTATRQDFIAMGLNESLINAIISYRNKGGKFDDADDFGKMYTLSPEDFQTLKPYIHIDQKMIPGQDPFEKPMVVIEINTADTLDLQQLPGIGPAFASRIIKYRELLGGYHDKEQLLEVYGMDSLRYAAIAENLTVDPLPIRKININKASIKDLINHPYIEFYLAKSIITYRESIGTYKNLDELLNARLIYKELFLKIAPYLTLSESDT
ncbi:MAG: helix-hairpin-helix domain-containing protein [Bacteroidetes bacterium]|nr:helix-hairpin-helix domain-containing protein [Bacteroidota bacterium]